MTTQLTEAERAKIGFALLFIIYLLGLIVQSYE